MKYIAKLTENGVVVGKIAYYCRKLNVSRQAFYDYLENAKKPYKHAILAAEIKKIISEDEYNDKYGRKRIREALIYKFATTEPFFGINIPSERTIYRIMEHENLICPRKRKPNGITKADRLAQKSDDLIKRDFYAEKPYEKCVTDITEIKCADGKLYVSAIFDCFNLECLSLEIHDNMQKNLVIDTLESAAKMHPQIVSNKAIIHSDRGSQYTSGGKGKNKNNAEKCDGYRDVVEKFGVLQSMNSAGGRCHDNARCEAMWARFKEECFYGRYDTKRMIMTDVKVIIWRYFMSYWNNRRICSAIGGVPPAEKKRRFFAAFAAA